MAGSMKPEDYNALMELQNRYREMDAQIRSSNDDSVQTIKMQFQKINKLRRDNKRIKEELELDCRQTKNSLQKTGSTSISTLQDQGDYYERKALQERANIEELDAQIHNMEMQILQQRSDMGGVNANRETRGTIQKNIRMLENRLEKAYVKYNEALGHNKKLREEIDNLRRDRAVFDGIYSKLQNDLEQKKQEMSKIMDNAMSAYESRVQTQVEMVKLKEQGNKELTRFEKEWKELNTMIEKNQRKAINQCPIRTSSARIAMDPHQDQEMELKARLTRGNVALTKDRLAIDKAEHQVSYYREAFRMIQEATGITDIDELAENFEEADKENFRLFNEANSLNKDIERLESQINEMNRKITKVKDDGLSSDNKRKQILNDLQSRLETTQNKIITYGEKYEQAMNTVDSLKNGIRDVLLCMNAERVDVDIIDRIDTVGINENNLMEFLAVIEKRTNDLIEDYLSYDNERANTFTQPSNINSSIAETASMGIGVGEVGNTLMIVPPTTLTDLGDEDEGDSRA